MCLLKLYLSESEGVAGGMLLSKEGMMDGLQFRSASSTCILEESQSFVGQNILSIGENWDKKDLHPLSPPTFSDITFPAKRYLFVTPFILQEFVLICNPCRDSFIGNFLLVTLRWGSMVRSII